jgi:ubiquinone/menaquinone biosynthesis C-methylase UbiE
VGFYDDRILPRLMNLAMAADIVARERAVALANVRGRVLEIGFGSGHNLPHYPSGVTEVIGIDPSGESAKLAKGRIEKAPFPVQFLPLRGEAIPAEDASFDAIVSTFTLCTVGEPQVALKEMRRVCRPDGRLFFLEHGHAPDAKVQRWQARLNGIQNALVGGCNLNRKMDQLIVEAGFELEQLETYYAARPKWMTHLYRGVARPRA